MGEHLCTACDLHVIHVIKMKYNLFASYFFITLNATT